MRASCETLLIGTLRSVFLTGVFLIWFHPLSNKIGKYNCSIGVCFERQMGEKDPEDPGVGVVPRHGKASEGELANRLGKGLAAGGKVLCWNRWGGKTWDTDP